MSRRNFQPNNALLRAQAVSNFKRARLDYLNDLDGDWPNNRTEGNARALRRQWMKLKGVFERIGETLPHGILGVDPRVVALLSPPADPFDAPGRTHFVGDDCPGGHRNG